MDTPDSYSLKIPIDEARELMGNTWNYERIVKMLELEEGELVLVDPREKEESALETAPVQGKQENHRHGPSESLRAKPKPSIIGGKVIKSQEFRGYEVLQKDCSLFCRLSSPHTHMQYLV